LEFQFHWITQSGNARLIDLLIKTRSQSMPVRGLGKILLDCEKISLVILFSGDQGPGEIKAELMFKEISLVIFGKPL
jgi:hypothetical protein